ATLLAGLGRPVLRTPVDADQSREPPIELVDRRLGAGADVRDAGGVGRGHRARDGVGDVADVDVVARLLAVAVHDARRAREQSRSRAADGTRSRRPVARLSTTSTEWPSASRRSTT